MESGLLQKLREITPEERYILEGKSEIEKNIYMTAGADVIDARKLMETGKLIEVRTHTRFIHFPKHTHNYIELIYMCSGQTHHVIDGEDVVLREGELLFLNQRAVQEIYAAREQDIAVNFIILPEFFDYALHMIEKEENLLRDFIVGCLRRKDEPVGYLHFKVADILPIQNLVENLIWSIAGRQTNKRSINQVTMGLLFLQLMNYMDKLEVGRKGQKQKLVIEVLSYIEQHYRDGELTVLAQEMHYDVFWLSKEIKKQTGKTYTELLQAKRMNQAAYLLNTTTLTVMDIALSVGYGNISYFHRIFQERYGMTPRKYRLYNRQ